MSERVTVCPQCGHGETSLVALPRRVRADDGTELEFSDQLTRCESCGEEFYTREQSLASSRASAAVFRQHEGLLVPNRIRAIREDYGLTQAEFERALGLGPKTVVRWENGTVRQGATANSLLLAIEGNAAAFLKVASSNGVEMPAMGVLEKIAGGGPVVSKFVSTLAASTSMSRKKLTFSTFRKVKRMAAKKVDVG